MKNIVEFVERLTRAAGVFAAWLLVPLTVILVYEVISRYVFNAPTFWAYEIDYMLAGTIFILGSAYALQAGRHIRIDFFYELFGPKTKATVNVLGYVFLFLPLAWWITWGLGGYAIEAYEMGRTSARSAWNPVIWPFRTILFIGFGILTLQATVELIKAVARFYGKDIGEEDSQ
jgi:TRAP-type mannitol/chloroaromatic compound transport system permease small subunit